MSYRKHLATIEPDGRIDYNRFLDRYMIVQEDSSSAEGTSRHSGWQAEVVRQLYEAVLREDLSLRETLAFFDKDGNGRVSFEDFMSVCEECDLGLTVQQARDLLRSMPHSAEDDTIAVAEFIERFHIAFVGPAGVDSLMEAAEPWIRELVSKVGRTIVGGGLSAVDIFHEFDSDGNGFLDHNEFCDAISTIESGSGRCSVSQEQLHSLAALVDSDGNGRISILEFCAAFVADDSGGFQGGSAGSIPEPEPELESERQQIRGETLSRQLSHGVVQAVASTIFTYRSNFRKAWLTWDEHAEGVVMVPEFKAGLTAVNMLLDRPMTNSQIDALVQHAGRRVGVHQDGHDMVDYEAFLQSFTVVDVEDPRGRNQADRAAGLVSTQSRRRAAESRLRHARRD